MATAILNHHMTAAQALSGEAASPAAATTNSATAKADATSNASSTSSDSSTISANDFLTLLVTEMKNQDPTANTDPNEYINQLVNVNSLEQLISINQTLTSDATGTAASAKANSTQAQAQSSSSGAATTLPGALHTAAEQLAPGNLGIPSPNAAAQSVAESLSGRSRVQ